jgi:hypothetical protein
MVLFELRWNVLGSSQTAVSKDAITTCDVGLLNAAPQMEQRRQVADRYLAVREFGITGLAHTRTKRYWLPFRLEDVDVTIDTSDDFMAGRDAYIPRLIIGIGGHDYTVASFEVNQEHPAWINAYAAHDPLVQADGWLDGGGIPIRITVETRSRQV